MTYVAILESTLAKLTNEEKTNLQYSLDSYFKEGFLKGYDEGNSDDWVP